MLLFETSVILNQRVDSFFTNEIPTKSTPQIGEYDIHFSYDDEIKINVENYKKRALILKSLESLSKYKDIEKHVYN